jgi:hypothetical protein
MSTPVLLVDGLKAFIEVVVNDYQLETKNKNMVKPPQVIAGYLPSKDPKSETPDFPFVIVRFAEGTDSDEDSRVIIKIIAGTYSEDAQEGWRDPANILQRIRTELMKHRVVGGKFRLEFPLRIEMSEEQPFPEWIGVMTTTWTIAQPVEEVTYE